MTKTNRYLIGTVLSIAIFTSVITLFNGNEKSNSFYEFPKEKIVNKDNQLSEKFLRDTYSITEKLYKKSEKNRVMIDAGRVLMLEAIKLYSLENDSLDIDLRKIEKIYNNPELKIEIYKKHNLLTD